MSDTGAATDRTVRPLRPDDDAAIDAVLELNQHWVPHVGSVTRDQMVSLVEQADLALVVERRTGDGPPMLEGFVVVMAPGADYDSPNYRYFEQARAAGDLGEFRYVDRIVVATAAHRRGVGRRLYDAVFDHARERGATTVTCEVNVEPPNPVSTAFHSSLGFVEVGRQSNYGGAVTVAFMTAPVRPND